MWREGASCCVVMVAGAYPGSVPKGMVIDNVPDPAADLVVFYAGARCAGTDVITAGGRVLGVTAYGETMADAQDRAYSVVETIHFDTAAWRSDIGR